VQIAIISENWQRRNDNAKGFRSTQSSSNYKEQRTHAHIISNATIKGVKKLVSLTKTEDNFCQKECPGKLPSFLLNWIMVYLVNIFVVFWVLIVVLLWQLSELD
jgi:hypothetical protein